LNEAFESALLSQHAIDTAFFYALVGRFEDAPKPLLSDHTCDIALDQLRTAELTFAMPEGTASRSLMIGRCQSGQ